MATVKDTRKQREMAVILASTGVAAIIGQLYLGPWVARMLNVKKGR